MTATLRPGMKLTDGSTVDNVTRNRITGRYLITVTKRNRRRDLYLTAADAAALAA